MEDRPDDFVKRAVNRNLNGIRSLAPINDALMHAPATKREDADTDHHRDGAFIGGTRLFRYARV